MQSTPRKNQKGWETIAAHLMFDGMTNRAAGQLPRALPLLKQHRRQPTTPEGPDDAQSACEYLGQPPVMILTFPGHKNTAKPPQEYPHNRRVRSAGADTAVSETTCTPRARPLHELRTY